MPKFINKGLSAQRECKVYSLRRCSSEPLLYKKSNSYIHLLKDYTNLLKDYKIQKVVKGIVGYQLDELKREFNTLKEKFQNMQRVSCQVCFSVVHTPDAIHMGDCGHIACRPCFVHSVVYSAIHLRQHNDVDTIEESWRCFSCREFNYSFLQCKRGVFTVKYIGYSSELRDAILHEYRTLEKSLKLPSLSQDFQENELSPEMNEENLIVEHQSVTSENNQPNEESDTFNNLRRVEPDEAVDNVNTLARAQVTDVIRATYRDQTIEGIETAEKDQVYDNATRFEESVLFTEINVSEVAHKSNESII